MSFLYGPKPLDRIIERIGNSIKYDCSALHLQSTNVTMALYRLDNTRHRIVILIYCNFHISLNVLSKTRITVADILILDRYL